MPHSNHKNVGKAQQLRSFCLNQRGNEDRCSKMPSSRVIKPLIHEFLEITFKVDVRSLFVMPEAHDTRLDIVRIQLNVLHSHIVQQRSQIQIACGVLVAMSEFMDINDEYKIAPMSGKV